MASCSMPDCDRRVKARGLCDLHYQRLKKRGDPSINLGQTGRPKTQQDVCSIPGCGGKTESLGWCDKHYRRAKRYGDPLTPHFPNRTVVDYTEKPCNKCGIVKPLEGGFYRDPGFADGHKAQCKSCDQERKRSPEALERQRQYNQSPQGLSAQQRYTASGKRAAAQAEYIQRPEVAELRRQRQPGYSHTYYLKHREELLAKSRTPENRAKQYARERKRREDPEYLAKARAYKLARYHARGDKAKCRTDAYRAYKRSNRNDPKNIERARLRGRRHKHLRVSRLLALPATLTITQWESALDWFGHACAYCGTAGVILAQDHVVPVSAGGAYVVGNIVPACKSCNSSKHSSSLETWAPPDVCQRVLEYLASIPNT